MPLISVHGRRRRFLFWALLLALPAYLLIATSLFGWVMWDILSMELSSVEPPPGQVARPLEEQFRYPEGKYGPSNPLRPIEFEGATPRTTINKQGLRCTLDLGPHLSENIVLLGDSFTFGYGLADHETLGAQLARLDPGHRYINAGQPLFNLHDAATRLHAMLGLIPTPSLVILQVLPTNDLTAEKFIEQRIQDHERRSQRLRFPPYNLRSLDHFLGALLRNRIWEELNADITKPRFDLYFKQAIARARAQLPRDTPLVLLVFEAPDGPDGTKLHGWLKAYAASIGMPHWTAQELLSEKDYLVARLSDGHPSAAMNRALARTIWPRIKALLAPKK